MVRRIGHLHVTRLLQWTRRWRFRSLLAAFGGVPLSSDVGPMSTTRKQSAAIAGMLWVLVVGLAALSSFGPVHRNDLPRYWSGNSFSTTVLGPLAVFRWPYPQVHLYTWEYVASVGFGVFIAAWTLWYVFRPRKWTLGILVALLAMWLLIGMGVTYAWV